MEQWVEMASNHADEICMLTGEHKSEDHWGKVGTGYPLESRRRMEGCFISFRRRPPAANFRHAAVCIIAKTGSRETDGLSNKRSFSFEQPAAC